MFFPKRSLLLLSVLLAGQAATAQHTTHQHAMPPAQTNIFVRMMDTMMVQMSAVQEGGSPELSFFRQMIPHHEAALAMATHEIAHGHDFSMIQLAKSIFTEQTSELQQMQEWVKSGLPDTPPASRAYWLSMDKTMKAMMLHMPADSLLTDTDQAFARVMIPHHQAAIDMARAVISFTHDPTTRAFARQLISAEQVEIEQMLSFLQ